MEDLLGRQAPHSLEAEQSVLGAMLIDNRCVSDVIGMLRPENFYVQVNREIFETIFEMFSYSEIIDPVTVVDKMRERGVFDEQNTTKYIAQLMQITPTAANVKQYARIVFDKALMRSLLDSASDIVEMVYEGTGTAQDLLETAEKRIFALRRGNTGDSLEHISTIVLKVYDRLAELAQSGSDISGISTGLRDLDKFISGLNKSDLMLLAARPGMGKTSLALNIALNVAKKYPKRTVAFFSLEMSKQQLVTRLISNESFIDNKKLTTGKLNDDDWSKIGIATSALSMTDLRVDDNPSITVAEMNAKLRRIDDLALVVIDGSQPLGEEDHKAISAAKQAKNAICILSKSDLPQVVSPEELDFDTVLPLSSVTGEGIEALAPAVERLFASNIPCDGTLLTNARHSAAITRARDAVGKVEESMEWGGTPDAVLLDLEDAIEAIAEVTGQSMREDITNGIFSRFCVGK